MNKKNFLIIFIVTILISCSPNKQIPNPSPTLLVQPTNTIIISSPTPIATATPIPSPTPTLGPDTANYHIFPEVTDEEMANFNRGLTKVRQYLLEYFGSDISVPFQVFIGPNATVLGQSDVNEDERDALVNWDYSGIRMYVNTTSDFVLEDGIVRLERTGIHETTHVWQVQHNCQKGYRWMMEGHAEYMSKLLFKGQFIRKEAVNQYWLTHGQNTETYVNSFQYVMKVAAFKWLIDHSGGPMSYTRYCELLGAETPSNEAFTTAFGMTVDEFYTRFQKQYIDPRNVSPIEAAQLSTYEKQLQGWEFLNPTLTSPNLRIQFEGPAGYPLDIQGFAICPPVGGCIDVRNLDKGFIELRLFPGIYSIRTKKPGGYQGWSAPPTYNYRFEVLAYEPRTLEIRLDTLARVSYRADGLPVAFDYGGEGIAYWLYDVPSPKTIITFQDESGNPLPGLPLLICEVFDTVTYECHGKLTDENGVLQDTLYTVFPYVIFANNPGESLTAPFDYRTEEFYPFGDKNLGVAISYVGQVDFQRIIILTGAVEGQTVDLKFLPP